MAVRSTLRIFFGVLFAFAAVIASATTTKIELILSAETARPGDTVTAGIRMTMQPGWHTYWQNPGGPGIPAEIKWTLPAGVSAGEIQWPVPEVVSNPPFINYAFNDEVILLVPLKIDSAAAKGSFNLQAHVTWQECKERCLQGATDVSAPLTIGADSEPSIDATTLKSARSKLPKVDTNLVITASWEAESSNRPLVLEWQTTNHVAEVDFFPYANTNYEVQGEVERLPDDAGKIRIRKLVTKSGAAWPAKIDGVWMTKDTTNSPPKGYIVTLTPTATAMAPVVANPGEKTSLLGALALAFFGGLMLNIMPCVLPVIALKILGFVQQAKESPGRVRTLGAIYGLGVLVSFLVLAGIAIAVQHAGGAFSWSSAFQNPQFRVIITTLITLVALNLFGVFEITLSSGAMTAATELTGKKGASGAFFNGVLATVLATPCTAPFLATALVFIVGQPAPVIILIFLMTGLGLAAPYVLLCWNPAWLKFLPKPGLWMQRFKVAMGFPMLATAIWLFWLTATRMGHSGVLWFGLFLVVLALAGWVWGEFAQRGTRRAGLAMVISLLVAVGAYGFALEHKLHWRLPPGTVTEANAIDWQPWSTQAVEKARAAGHPVLVDFTADTCVNCQVNKALRIEIPETRKKLKEINAVTLEADFTDSSPAIAHELQRLGQGGIPVVVVYSADRNRAPIIIPGLFKTETILAALDQAAKRAL
jgi:thiol:disulfide interchange protein DsbD